MVRTAKRNAPLGRRTGSGHNRRPAEPISRERVVAATLASIEMHGLDGLSMRRLATRLGIRATTLYYYYPNKAAILDSVVETILFDAPRPQLSLDDPWVAHLRAYAVAFYESLRKHPRLVPLVATHSVQSPRSLAAAEAFLAPFYLQGLSPLQSVQVLNIVSTYVLGHALAEVGSVNTASVSADPLPQPPDVRDFPLLAEAIKAGLGQPVEHQARFMIGLDALLTGFSMTLAQAPSQDAII